MAHSKAERVWCCHATPLALSDRGDRHAQITQITGRGAAGQQRLNCLGCRYRAAQCDPSKRERTDAAPTALAAPVVNAQLEKMQAAHAKLAAAKTAAERRLAMQEAMQVMQDSMHMMPGQTTENGCMGDMRMGMGHAQVWYGYADKNARPAIEHAENAHGPVS